MLPLLFLASHCPDLSGTYRLVNSDQGGCYAQSRMEESPLPVKTSIAEGDWVEIEQNHCESFQVRYLDRRRNPAHEVTRTFRINSETSTRHRIISDHEGPSPMAFGGVSGQSTLHWMLRLDRKQNLIFKFRSQTEGFSVNPATGMIMPVLEYAWSRCHLARETRAGYDQERARVPSQNHPQDQ